jgi:hypothetical protein
MNRTLSGLRFDLIRTAENAWRGELPPITTVTRSGWSTLSFATQRLWLLAQISERVSHALINGKSAQWIAFVEDNYFHLNEHDVREQHDGHAELEYLAVLEADASCDPAVGQTISGRLPSNAISDICAPRSKR